MPRRRLHGETQKRRKKPQTRLLKRSESVVRPSATQQPAPFERSPQIEREDLEFLEAMRELEVRRTGWQGESVSRRRAIETVHFLAEEGEDALFQRSMTHLGVAPLNGRPRDPRPAEASEPTARPPMQAGPAARPSTEPAATPPTAAPAVSAPGPAEEPAPAAANRAEPVAFEPAEDAAALMEALLADDDFRPELKFAGVGAAPRRPNGRGAGRNGPADDAEPDDELDLHGKTQEEAIGMVQNFLLVCHRRRLRHVLIITGRGLNSGPGGPVLKEAVYRWLDLNGRRFARRFERAPARLGGEGAIWVTLK